MIRVRLHVGSNGQSRIDELYDAVRGETKTWAMGDLRRRRNLVLKHTSGRVAGTVRRARSADREWLEFHCVARDADQEAITTGRFVNLVLRYLQPVRDVWVERD